MNLSRRTEAPAGKAWNIIDNWGSRETIVDRWMLTEALDLIFSDAGDQYSVASAHEIIGDGAYCIEGRTGGMRLSAIVEIDTEGLVYVLSMLIHLDDGTRLDEQQAFDWFQHHYMLDATEDARQRIRDADVRVSCWNDDDFQYELARDLGDLDKNL